MNEQGRVKLHQVRSPAVRGTVGGALWGGLSAVVPRPAARVSVGAAAGGGAWVRWSTSGQRRLREGARPEASSRFSLDDESGTRLREVLELSEAVAQASPIPEALSFETREVRRVVMITRDRQQSAEMVRVAFAPRSPIQ